MKNKIVIIDDNVVFTQAMVFLLEIYKNIDILVYNNAIDFCNDYSNNWCGVLLIDLFMPKLDGFSLLTELKKRNNKMYTIAISGHADKNARKRAHELGATEFLFKPFNTNQFLEKLHQYKII